MEAVVKSLDPNVTTHREAVLDTATEIIGYVVKTYVKLALEYDFAGKKIAHLDFRVWTFTWARSV